MYKVEGIPPGQHPLVIKLALLDELLGPPELLDELLDDPHEQQPVVVVVIEP